ncbi:MAG: hypothetical protein WC613_04870 [Candidatus Aenigmatarchaeota archaeon]
MQTIFVGREEIKHRDSVMAVAERLGLTIGKTYFVEALGRTIYGDKRGANISLIYVIGDDKRLHDYPIEVFSKI